MYRNENDIIILVDQFHHLMHPFLVVFHADKAAEYSHSIIYMDNIIPY